MDNLNNARARRIPGIPGVVVAVLLALAVVVPRPVRATGFVGDGAAPLAGVAVGVLPSTAGVDTVEPVSQTGSITVLTQAKGSDGKLHVLAGDSFAVARVADGSVRADGTVVFQTRAAFAGLGVDWDSVTAGGLRSAADAAEVTARTFGLFGVPVKVGEGQTSVRFDGLEPGVYLVSRVGVDAANRGFTSKPSLVYVPMRNADGTLTYDVEVDPKYGWDKPGNPDNPGPTPDNPTPDNPNPDNPDPTPGNPGTDTPTPGTPQNPGFTSTPGGFLGGLTPETGDRIAMGSLAVMAVCGAVLVVLSRLSKRA